MNDCSKYINMISAMTDGELSAGEELQLHAHMESCPDCRRVYDAFSAISDAMDDNFVEPPEALAKGIMFKINMQQAKNSKKHRFAFGRFTAIAACFAIIVFGMSRFGLLDGLKNATGSGKAEPQDASEVGDIGGDMDLELEIIDPDKIILPKQDAPPTRQPETSSTPVPEEETGASLFGNGDLADDLMLQETEQFKTEVSKLLETENIKIYQGKYDPAAENAATVVPLYTVIETETLKKLAELLEPEALLKDRAENLSAENTVFTIFIPANKSADLEAKDVLLTIWNVDGKLICQKNGDTPIRFTLKTTGSELEEFIRKLTV